MEIFYTALLLVVAALIGLVSFLAWSVGKERREVLIQQRLDEIKKGLK
jgi:hypothetical protein